MFRGPRIPKTQKPDSSPLFFYSGTLEGLKSRIAQGETIRVVSVDPSYTINFAIRIEDRYTDGRVLPVDYRRINLIRDEQGNEIANVYDRLTQALLEKIDEILRADLVVIERQLPMNYRNVRINQHVLSFFLLMVQGLREGNPMFIVEVDPKLKGKMLGAGPLNERGLKAWAVEEARKLFEQRGDALSAQILKKATKKDDLADSCLQIEGVLLYISRS